MFNHIDSWLLRQHQNIANWTDVRYDKNCYWWGYVLTEMLCIFLPAFMAFLLADYYAQSPKDRSLIGLVLFFCLLSFVTYLELRQRSTRLEQASSRRPIPTVSSPFFRLIYTFLTISNGLDLLSELSLLNFLDFAVLISWASRSYFDACLPMPPHEKEQKRSELFDGVPEAA